MTDMAIITYSFSLFAGLFLLMFGNLGGEDAKTSIGKFFARSSFILGATMLLTLAIKLFIELVML